MSCLGGPKGRDCSVDIVKHQYRHKENCLMLNMQSFRWTDMMTHTQAHSCLGDEHAHLPMEIYTNFIGLSLSQPVIEVVESRMITV